MSDKKYFDTRRDWIVFAIDNLMVDKNNLTGSALLKAYRERQEQYFCRQIYKDELYEKFWQIGFKVGCEQSGMMDFANKETKQAITATKSPANPFSRICGEVAMLAKETAAGKKCCVKLYKKGLKGVYTTKEYKEEEVENCGLLIRRKKLQEEIKQKQEELDILSNKN